MTAKLTSNTTSKSKSFQTPKSAGYRMPAEWERHEATWLSWPKDPVTWPGRVPQAEEIFIKMITVLSPHETVNLLVNDAKTEENVSKRLKAAGTDLKNVKIHKIVTVDSWIRDYGPIFIIRERKGVRPLDSRGLTPFREIAYTDWIFNAWGGKYADLAKDNVIPEKLEPVLKIPRFETRLVLEGGSIDVNGSGTLLTTEQCLLTNTRNPHLSKEGIEKALSDYLGIKHVIWLGEGIVGDDTDGHVDDIVRFVGPKTVICALEEDEHDANYPMLKENYERLKQAVDQDGKKLEVIPFPMPGKVMSDEGRLPASYANFYIANHVVLVPVFGHKNDKFALAILKEMFPKREIAGIHCEPLVWGLGAIHCVTQQQPA